MTAKERLLEMVAAEPGGDLRRQYIWTRRRAREQGRLWRGAYAWSVLRAVTTAKGLGIDRISALEFGVAGGNGLLALETVADLAEELSGVRVEVVGFDSGGGLPPPTDPRDVPFFYGEGDYPMDEAKLRARLQRADLRLGLVSETVPQFLSEDHPPVGFMSNDLDYYSSTMDSFGILDADPDRLLPRVVSYFDDVALYPWTDFNGELAAIHEFNATHDQRKISRVYGIRWSLTGSEMKLQWPDQMFIAELFDHPLYSTPELVQGREALHLAT